ncbi:DUF2975 domain-containing protein [Algibacter aquimarinus]
MKTLKTLKKLIKFYYYFLLTGFIIFIILPILFTNGMVKSFNLVEGYDFNRLELFEFSLIILVLVCIYYLFVRAIYLLKSTLKDLSEGNYFSELVITNFKTIGKLILACGISFSLYRFILRLLLLSEIKPGIDNGLIVSIILGLFFMFLSEVFAKARKTKEENDLTI